MNLTASYLLPYLIEMHYRPKCKGLSLNPLVEHIEIIFMEDTAIWKSLSISFSRYCK